MTGRKSKTKVHKVHQKKRKETVADYQIITSSPTKSVRIDQGKKAAFFLAVKVSDMFMGADLHHNKTHAKFRGCKGFKFY